MPLSYLKSMLPVDLGQGTPGATFQISISTIKLAVLFSGTASVLFLVKLAVPFSHELLLSTVPRLWVSVCKYLARPYLFFTVNFIILLIWRLSDKMQHHRDASDSEVALSKHKDLDAATPLRRNSPETRSGAVEIPDEVPPAYNASTLVEIVRTVTSSEVTTEPDEKSAASSRPAAMESIKPLQVPSTAVEEEQDSMDATWNTITGGAAPAKRQLKKSDTWEATPNVEAEPDPPPPPSSRPGLTRRELKKSQTFKEASTASPAWNASRRVGMTRKGDLLMANDELNQRIEAFIKKGYEDLRLQRQESYQRYIEAVNRGY